MTFIISFVFLGPKPKTVNDFWRMIFEHKCPTIVMLTTLKEMGKVMYKRLIASVKSQTKNKDVERLILFNFMPLFQFVSWLCLFCFSTRFSSMVLSTKTSPPIPLLEHSEDVNIRNSYCSVSLSKVGCHNLDKEPSL